MKLTSFFTGSLLVISMVSCSGLYPAPVETPTPTSTGTSTPTIIWFPPTNTPTEFPTQTIVPTEEYHTGVGDLIFSDSFDSLAGTGTTPQPKLWDTSTSSWASATLNRNRLVLSITGQGPVSLTSMRSQPALLDFYAEATVTVSLCSGKDQYGMVFRSASGGYYRFVLSCEGQVRLDRASSGSLSSQMEWLTSGDAPDGAQSEVKIGVWALGSEMRFYLNDHYQFTKSDLLPQAGSLGFFIYANKTTPVTVSFSDLKVYSVFKVSPTLAPTASVTPNP